MGHIAFVRDGSIVLFPNSARTFMKVCDARTGNGGVVDISNGQYIPTHDLERYGLGLWCEVLYRNIDKMMEDCDA